MDARSVRREELHVDALAPHGLNDLDLHVAAAREAEHERARNRPAAQLVCDVAGREADELAAAERAAQRVLGGLEIGHDPRLLEESATNAGEQRADVGGASITRRHSRRQRESRHR